MEDIRVRDLEGDYGFGARVDGVTWDNLYVEDLRAELSCRPAHSRRPASRRHARVGGAGRAGIRQP